MTTTTEIRRAKLFFADLRAELAANPATGKGSGNVHKHTLQTVFTRHTQLSSNLNEFVTHLIHNNTIEALAYKKTRKFKRLACKWLSAISDTYCGNCKKKLDAKTLLTPPPTRARYCDAKCSANTEAVKNKFKKTCLRKFGTEAPTSTPAVQLKTQRTVQARYGVSHIMQIGAAQAKRVRTWSKNYSTGHPNRDPIVSAKTRATCEERYGGQGLASPSMHKRYKATVKRRYGVAHVSHIAEVHDKQRSFTYKKLTIGDKTFKGLQGYEPQAIKLLVTKGIEVGRIKSSRAEVDSFYYEHEGEEHVYFPDLKITGEIDTFVEVKSYYTFNFDKPQLRAKLKAVRDLGYRVMLLIMSGHGKLMEKWVWEPAS